MSAYFARRRIDELPIISKFSGAQRQCEHWKLRREVQLELSHTRCVTYALRAPRETLPKNWVFQLFNDTR